MSLYALSRGKGKIRNSMLYAVMYAITAWAIFVAAETSDFWQLAFLSLLCIGWGIFQDISREGYFHPALVFTLFSLLMVLVTMCWMATFIGEIFFYFSYEFLSTPDGILTLAREELILLTSAYAGYLLIRGIGRRRVEYTRMRHHTAESLWWVSYLVGISALLALIMASGGFAELFGNLGAKYERREGRAELFLLEYFAYAGALLWYKKNIWRATWQRYGGLVVLVFPLLFLSASRVGMLISLIAALFMDERTGKRPSLKAIAACAVILAVFFALYQSFRTQSEVDILLSNYKDFSLGVGYIIALDEGIVGGQLRLGTLLTALSAFVPTIVKESFGFPLSPNFVFTSALFPGAGATFSMGIWGEANYMLHSWLSFLYYLAIGSGLTWAVIYGQRRSLLLTAIVAGGAVRLARGGITGGLGNILLFVIPIVLVYAVVFFLPRRVPRRPVREDLNSNITLRPRGNEK